MTDSSTMVDSSVWLEYIVNGKCAEYINNNKHLVVSALTFFEIKKKMILKDYAEEDIQKALEFVEERGLIIAVDEKIATKAANMIRDKKISMADAIIYTTARIQNIPLLTLDNDFRHLPHVQVLSIKD